MPSDILSVTRDVQEKYSNDFTTHKKIDSTQTIKLSKKYRHSQLFKSLRIRYVYFLPKVE